MDPERDKGNEVGDAWIFDAVKRNTYFFITFAVGRLNEPTCVSFLLKLKNCFVDESEKETPEFYSDTSQNRYTKHLAELFNRKYLRYGQLMKFYSDNGRLCRKIRKTVYGKINLERIDTTNIENFHSILRERTGRLVRKTKCHSRLKTRLEDALQLFRFYWNFMNKIDGKRTPAMKEGLAKNALNWDEFLHLNLTALD